MKKKYTWLRWAVLIVCLCLMAGILLPHLLHEKQEPALDSPTVDLPAIEIGCYLNNDAHRIYYRITAEKCEEYGITDETVTKADLGTSMGTVTGCYDPGLIDCKVYHFNKFPDDDSICIIETQDGYALYTGIIDRIVTEVGESSDEAFAAYGLPDSLVSIQVRSTDHAHFSENEKFLFEVTDEMVIEELFQIFSGKINTGRDANEYNFAMAWQNAYGNRDVYYDDGVCFYENGSYDKAQKLWTQGARVIRFAAKDGFVCRMEYYPLIRTFIWTDGFHNPTEGYYELSPAEADRLNELLQVEEFFAGQ